VTIRRLARLPSVDDREKRREPKGSGLSSTEPPHCRATRTD
jgi:hypothetical protein